MHRPASVTAKLCLINIKRFINEKNKDYSRVRLSKNTLRQLSGGVNIHDTRVELWAEEFARLGWHFFVHTDTEYALLKADRVNSWAKTGASRVRDLISKFDSGDVDVVDNEYDELFGIDNKLPLADDE